MTGTLWLIVGPSGVGKSTLARGLFDTLGMREVVSVTTRDPRPGEVDGVHYRFISRPDFDFMKAAGELIEAVEYNGHGYGSTRADVLSLLANGDACIVVDGHGAQAFRAALPCTRTLFLLPPSDEALRARLAGRGDSTEAIAKRMSSKESEMRHAGAADHLLFAASAEEVLRAAVTVIHRSSTGKAARRPAALARTQRKTDP